jgi:hypothetical protein
LRRAAGAACLAALTAGVAMAAEGPTPPCTAGAAPAPAYAALGEPPAFAVWHGSGIVVPGDCREVPDGKLTFALALAARLDGSRSLDEFATRIGAVSAMKTIRYWTVSNDAWRGLIDDAAALAGPDAAQRRPDFSATEILSGETHYVALNDNRSTGINVFSVAAHTEGPDRLVVAMTNLSSLDFGPFTIFDKGTLHAVHFIERLPDGSWGYYTLWSVTAEDIGDPEKSFLNRANALYRFFANIPTDSEPPLVRQRVKKAHGSVSAGGAAAARRRAGCRPSR